MGRFLPRRDSERDRRLDRSVIAAACECVRELVAGVYAQLVVHLPQVVRDGARADEEPGADLGVRQAVGGEPRDLCFLRGQVVARLDAPLAGVLRGRVELDAGALREVLSPDCAEQALSHAQMPTGLEPAPLPAQRLAVEQMR